MKASEFQKYEVWYENNSDKVNPEAKQETKKVAQRKRK